MRWLLVSRQHHPSHGGIGTYVQRFCRAARAADWHVELVTQPGDHWPVCAKVHEVRTIDMEPEFDARVDRLRRMHRIRPYRYALWSKAAAERLLSIRGKYDVIEFVDCQAEGFAALGCRAVRERFSDAAFIVHAHTPMFVEERINKTDESQFGRAIYHDWERRALAAADGVIATGSVLTRHIVEIATPSPPADAARTDHRTRSRERAGEREQARDSCAVIIPYPIDEDRPMSTPPREERILLIGTVQPRKGVDTWAKSLSRVLSAQPRATALLIGADTPTAPDGRSMIANVHDQIEPRVRDRFKWIGSMPHDQTRDLIAKSALVVVPSVLESFSFAAAEALLAGTPALVSDQTGIVEHVPSLCSVKFDDVTAWGDAQIETLRNHSKAQDEARACRREMLESCAPSRVLAAREAFVDALAQRQGAAATAAGDSLVEMARFIAEVDAESPNASFGASKPLASSVQS